MTSIRLLLCERHRLFRQGLALRLKAEPNLHVLAEAATGEEALRLTKRERPQVVLLDLSITAPSGLEVMQVLSATPRAPAVIALSEHADLPHLYAAQFAGAAAYVLKDAEFSHLLSTIMQVALQPTRLSIKQVTSLHADYGQRVKKVPEISPPQLAERHERLLALLVKGHSNRHIATVLGIKEKTVRNELSRLYRKLGVRSRTEAALLAVKKGLLPQREEL